MYVLRRTWVCCSCLHFPSEGLALSSTVNRLPPSKKLVDMSAICPGIVSSWLVINQKVWASFFQWLWVRCHRKALSGFLWVTYLCLGSIPIPQIMLNHDWSGPITHPIGEEVEHSGGQGHFLFVGLKVLKCALCSVLFCIF